VKNFDYFYTGELSLPVNQYQIYYDFNEIGANPIIPQGSSNPRYSGIISSLGSFYSVSGSGLFSSSQNISIQNASGLNATSFTAFFVYEKNYTGNAVLFSSLTSGGSVPSGFIIGINDANRLYFECYDQNGQNIYTSSNIYGGKNAVAVVKQNNILNFMYYNFNTQSIEPENFFISSTALYQNNQAYLGSPVNAPTYVTEKSFSGYMDQFVYINTALTSNTISTLFSGFFASGLPDTVVVVDQTNDFITGASIQLAEIGTGVTGFGVYLSGYVFDNDSRPLPVFLYNNLTGAIIEDTFVPLTSSLSFQVSGLINNGYYVDTGYCNSFGMDGVNLMRPIDSSDYNLELYAYQTINLDNLGLTTSFNNNGWFAMDAIFPVINLYINGIAYNSGMYYLSGNSFINITYLSGNYYLTGNSIVIDSAIKATDTVTFDVISGTPKTFILTSSTGQSFATTQTSNIIFLNGQKLVSGTDYTYGGGNLNINATLATGSIISFPMITNFEYTSGRFLSRFGRDTSMFWLNGQRQVLNKDYVEISNIDLLQGSGIFQIYNSSLQINQFTTQW